MSFGGGALQSFGVNSNTTACGFLKCMYRKTVPQENSPAKKPPGNLQKLHNLRAGLDDSSDDEKPTSSEEIQPLPMFINLYRGSPLVKLCQQYGNSIIPLSIIGMLMNYVGNHLLEYMSHNWHQKVFYPCHTVTSV
jgi:hypothetical protein